MLKSITIICSLCLHAVVLLLYIVNMVIVYEVPVVSG